MLTLAEMRAAQKAAGVTAHPDSDGTSLPSQVESDGTSLPSQVESDGTSLPSQVESDGTSLPSQVESDGTSLPSQVESDGTSLPSQVVEGSVCRHKSAVTSGYCRIFPPTFNSMSDIPEDWKQANWQSPSPWCKVEGQPEHPEFEANLAALERALS